jgi:hypothetical protein
MSGGNNENSKNLLYPLAGGDANGISFPLSTGFFYPPVPPSLLHTFIHTYSSICRCQVNTGNQQIEDYRKGLQHIAAAKKAVMLLNAAHRPNYERYHSRKKEVG